MPISDFLPLMPDTITYASVASRNEFGKAVTFNAAVSYRARVIKKNQRILDEAKIPTITVWVNGVIPTLQLDDQITLPDGSTPEIINWEQYSDEQSGSYYMKVVLGGITSRARA